MIVLLLPPWIEESKLEAHRGGAFVKSPFPIGVLTLALASCAGAPGGGEEIDIIGRWRVEDVDHGGVIDNAMVSVEFSADGRVFGRGGCNRYGGGYSRENDTLTVSEVVSTKMACAPALMDLEQKFFNRLSGELAVSMNGDGALVLGDDDGRILLRRMEGE